MYYEYRTYKLQIFIYEHNHLALNKDQSGSDRCQRIIAVCCMK